jgi:amidophosphoribosyltransferase
MIRNAGAREVHVRVSAPPTIGSCHYGIDMPTRSELIAHSRSVEEIRESIGVTSLGYLSLEGLRRVAQQLKHGHCDSCFSDDYPVPIDPEQSVPQLSLFRPVGEEGGEEDGEEPEADRRVPEA